jgi:type III restriction enzyme
LQAHPHQIEGLWFTGGLTDAGKTDLRAEYLGDDGRWHTYTPDFVLRRADGKHLVVEVKSDKLSPDINADMARHAVGEAPQTLEGRKAVALKRWEQLNPDRLSYHVMFADTALHDAGKKPCWTSSPTHPVSPIHVQPPPVHKSTISLNVFIKEWP